ncbi:helix-turn-helix domain-containing protein [Brevibacillus sp. SYSU BS000544]|uniref:helix-turn-helix domain-containing protein n=1 Tax=Brevibacillus sp. SYSU BS000544 TaxID=3416443 RepID=UPI003CE54DF8
MSELGQVLQRAREEKGISLDDVQRITKIQRRYLEAIERGHFHILPGHFYARAFIKSYAEAVGLDPNHILSHFQSDLPAQPPQEQMERLRRRRVAASKEPLQAGRWVTKSLFVLFVALVIGVIYTAIVNKNGLDTSPIPRNDVVTTPEVQTPTATAPNAVPSPSTQTQGTQPNTPSITLPPAGTSVTEATTAQLAFESQQGKVYRYTLKGAEKISLKVKAVNGDCWFEVRESRTAKPIEKGMLKKGTEKLIDAAKTAYIIVGSPTAVELSVNNSPIKTADLKFFPSILDIKIAQPQ